MRSPSRRARFAKIAALGLLAVVALAIWAWTHSPDPVEELRAHSGRLVAVLRLPAGELGARVERWRMVASNGDTTEALWREATQPSAIAPTDRGRPGREPSPERPWVVVMLGGIGTDERALLLLPDSLPVSVLAVSWPWSGPRRMGRLDFLRRIPAMRRALLRTPGAMALGVQAARREYPESRAALLGVSLGAPPAVAASSLVRPDAVVLVDGAADLERLLGSEANRALGGGLSGAILGPPLGALGARLLASLEPARHAHPGRAIATLLVEAEHEDRYPPACVERLRAAFPSARRVTHPGGHVRARDSRQVAALVETIERWLASLAEGKQPTVRSPQKTGYHPSSAHGPRSELEWQRDDGGVRPALPNPIGPAW